VGERGLTFGRGYAEIFATLGVLLLARILVWFPAILDYPLTRLLNTGAGRPLFDTIIFDLEEFYTPSGIVFLTVIWFCWSSSSSHRVRSHIMMGTVSALIAGMVSRLLQHVLPSHARPLHDAALGFHLPSGIDPTALNAWNSFPSDHAAVWFGLATVIAMVRPRLGVAALALALLSSIGRVYLGFHYPSDVLGGAGLGAAFVFAARTEPVERVGLRVCTWGERHAPLFYAAAFLLSYQIATLFDDVRLIGGSIANLLRSPSL